MARMGFEGCSTTATVTFTLIPRDEDVEESEETYTAECSVLLGRPPKTSGHPDSWDEGEPDEVEVLCVRDEQGNEVQLTGWQAEAFEKELRYIEQRAVKGGFEDLRAYDAECRASWLEE